MKNINELLKEMTMRHMNETDLLAARLAIEEAYRQGKLDAAEIAGKLECGRAYTVKNAILASINPPNKIACRLDSECDVINAIEIYALIKSECQDQLVKVKFLNALREMVSKDKPKNKAGNAIVSDYDLIVADRNQLIDALVIATGKWIKNEPPTS
jgi:hypothetical protein